MDDPKCRVCGEFRSAHVATKEGPLTHPREARGEGIYVFQSYWEGFDFDRGEWRRDEHYRFEPSKVEEPK